MPSLPSGESVLLDQSVFDQDGDQNGVEDPSDSIFKFPEALSEDEDEAVEEEAVPAVKKGAGGKKRIPVPPKPSGGKAPRKALAAKAKAGEDKPKSTPKPPPAAAQTSSKKRKAPLEVPAERQSKKSTSQTTSGDAEPEEGNNSSEALEAAPGTVADASRHSQDKKNPSTRKKRSPTARPHRRLDQEVVDFRVEKIESRVARLAKQMEVASKHLKAYKKEIEYRRLEQEEDSSSSDAQC